MVLSSEIALLAMQVKVPESSLLTLLIVSIEVSSIEEMPTRSF